MRTVTHDERSGLGVRSRRGTGSSPRSTDSTRVVGRHGEQRDRRPAGDDVGDPVAPGEPGVDVRAHRVEGYVETLRVAEGAPRGTIDGLDAWQASAGGVLGRPVRSVSELVIERVRPRKEQPVRRVTRP